MSRKFITFVLILVNGFIGTSSADENPCLEASHCNLIKGDIARESEKYNKDPIKFYKDAEEGVSFYAKYLRDPDNTTLKLECERLAETCDTEAAKMAVEDLNFPVKYRETCNYESYSRSLFDCRNIKKWPKDVKDHLPIESKMCRTQCIITDETVFTLSTGKIVNTWQADDLPSGDVDIDAMQAEQRKTDSNRKIIVQFTAFDEKVSRSNWSQLVVCPDNTWALGTDHIVRGDYLDELSFRCNEIPNNTILNPDKTKVVDTDTQTDTRIEGGYFLPFGAHCGSVPRRPGEPISFIVGLSFNTEQFLRYGKIPLYTNFICATSTGWTYQRRNTSISEAIPDSKELLCPLGSALCSVQAKTDKVENMKSAFLVNIRIGCCEGDARYPKLFQQNVTNDGSTPPPVTTSANCPGAEEILTLQKRSASYFIFWDESEVLNDIITRYNIYYSPAQLPNEDECEAGLCKPGEFLGSFEVRDPMSCYFQGRRIPEIRFNCSSKDGKKGDVLNLYKRLKTGHTLQDSKFFDAKDCTGGIYTGMELTYYVNKEYPYLVNAWGLKMKCSTGADHEVVMKAYPRLDLTALGTEKAAVNCEAGKAICGFNTKIADKHDGVFEGLYFKVVCCPL